MYILWSPFWMLQRVRALMRCILTPFASHTLTAEDATSILQDLIRVLWSVFSTSV